VRHFGVGEIPVGEGLVVEAGVAGGGSGAGNGFEVRRVGGRDAESQSPAHGDGIPVTEHPVSMLVGLFRWTILTRDGATDFEQSAFTEVSLGTECPVGPVRSDSRCWGGVSGTVSEY
jgi:hypothetical protein